MLKPAHYPDSLHVTFLKGLNRKRQEESHIYFNCCTHVKTCKFSPLRFRNSPRINLLNSSIWILCIRLKGCTLLLNRHLMPSLVSSIIRTLKLQGKEDELLLYSYTSVKHTFTLPRGFGSYFINNLYWKNLGQGQLTINNSLHLSTITGQ